jgi:hypothetical protein
VSASASVAISDIPLFSVVAKSSLCKTKLVQSYINIVVQSVLITQVCGSLPSSVFMLFAHLPFMFILQAHVFVVVNLHGIIIPVVYVVSAGVRLAVYVSLPVVDAQYTKLQLWIVFASSEGQTTNKAHVPHVTVAAATSACVAISTLPATVVLAFACVLHADTALHAPHIY